MSVDARRAGAFGAGADAYVRGRPGYPEAALRACLPAAPRRVLDLAAGTGKLTQGLLARGLDVVAVEPLTEMRARIDTCAEILDGRAEAIPLPAGSVDAVLIGQAFHWFDRDRALAEIVRVLRPGGTVGLLWNLLDDRVPWVAEIAALIAAEDRHTTLAQTVTPPWSGVAGLDDPVAVVIDHEQPADADVLVANIASRSPVILTPEAERADLLARVRALAPADRFAIPHTCVVWHAGRRATA
jgi:SAM-dependent methyltransferase